MRLIPSSRSSVTGYQWKWQYQYMDAAEGVNFFSDAGAGFEFCARIAFRHRSENRAELPARCRSSAGHPERHQGAVAADFARRHSRLVRARISGSSGRRDRASSMNCGLGSIPGKRASIAGNAPRCADAIPVSCRSSSMCGRPTISRSGSKNKRRPSNMRQRPPRTHPLSPSFEISTKRESLHHGRCSRERQRPPRRP